MASININGDSSGSVTLAAPSAAGSTTLTLPAVSGNVLASGSTGVCKAWCYFSASGGTVSGLTSFNVSSVTRTGGGIFQVNYTTAMPSSSYASIASTGNGSPGSSDNAGAIRMYQGTTTYGYFATGTSGFSAFQDNAYNSFVVFSN